MIFMMVGKHMGLGLDNYSASLSRAVDYLTDAARKGEINLDPVETAALLKAHQRLLAADGWDGNDTPPVTAP